MCCSNCLLLLSAGATGARSPREVPHPVLHVHRLREPPQTLLGAQPGQAGYSRGEGGQRKCKYTSQFLTTLSPSTSARPGNVTTLCLVPPTPPASSSSASTVSLYLCASGSRSSPPSLWCWKQKLCIIILVFVPELYDLLLTMSSSSTMSQCLVPFEQKLSSSKIESSDEDRLIHSCDQCKFNLISSPIPNE